MHATRAAVRRVSCGGVALLRARNALDAWSSTRDSGRAQQAGGRSRNRWRWRTATRSGRRGSNREGGARPRTPSGSTRRPRSTRNLIKAGNHRPRPRWCGRRSQKRRRSRGSFLTIEGWWRRSRRTRNCRRPPSDAQAVGLLQEWCLRGPPLPAAATACRSSGVRS